MKNPCMQAARGKSCPWVCNSLCSWLTLPLGFSLPQFIELSLCTRNRCVLGRPKGYYYIPGTAVHVYGVPGTSVLFADIYESYVVRVLYTTAKHLYYCSANEMRCVLLPGVRYFVTSSIEILFSVGSLTVVRASSCTFSSSEIGVYVF